MIIVICCNDSFAAYTFRLKLIKALMNKGYKVYVFCGYDAYTNKLVSEGVKVINVNIEKTGKNIFADLKLYYEFKRLIKKIKPNILINYTVKPHLYCTLAARNKNIKIINFVAGVGSIFLHENILKKFVLKLYKLVSRYVWAYIFLNETDYADFNEYNILRNNKVFFVSSEGVDLERFSFEKIDSFDNINFIFVGRLVKEKGLVEFLKASELIKQRFNNVNFFIAGDIYQKKNSSISLETISDYENRGIVKYLGFSEEMNQVYKNMHAVVLPSYREGMPISLIEGLAMGKVGIASDVAGCRNVIDDGVNGFLFKPRNVVSLQTAIKKYLKVPNDIKMKMSQQACEKASQTYDVKKIVPYLINIIEMD